MRADVDPPALAAALAAVLGGGACGGGAPGGVPEGGAAGEVTGLHRLAGGASRQTWAFTWRPCTGPPQELVLRRDSPATRDAQVMAREAQVLAAAAAAGVPVPRLVAHGDGADGVGAPWLVLSRVEGETIPRKLLREERFADVRPRLARELGRALARVHGVPLAQVPLAADGADAVAAGTAAGRLAAIRAEHDSYGEPRPALELVLRRLELTCPPPAAPALVHGDFRNGNLIIAEDGLRAVLDWELVHVGDPTEDLGWLCATAWRFGASAPVGGFGSREELLAGYAEVAGHHPSTAELHWWEVFATAHWAVLCRRQAQRHLGGAEQAMELAVVGRRIAECEYDALVALGLIEPGPGPQPLPGNRSDESVPAPPDAAPFDRPTAEELLDAVGGFLLEELTDAPPGLRFQARVAANAVRIARREQDIGPELRRAHRDRLAELGEPDDAALAAAVRAGRYDERLPALLAVVDPLVRAKLQVANPGYLVE